MLKSPSRRFAEISQPSRPTGAVKVLMPRAIVLGAGMAGLLAARVLSDHAEEVVILEWDDADVAAGPRPGVPHGSQVHGLLPAGQVQLERWFPGFTEEAFAAGAVPPSVEDVYFFMNGRLRPTPMVDSEPALVTTRPFLEALVRRRTLARDNVRMVTGRATGLVIEGDRVTGVRYRPGVNATTGNATAADATTETETETQERTESAALVLDAMGRSSRAGDWLEEHGRPRPPMSRMPIKLNYATALFRRDSKVADISVAVSFTAADERQGRVARIGGVNAVEGDRWMMLVAGYDEDRPDRSVADFTARCREDFPPVFGEIAEHGEMLGPVVTYHQADSRRRDFHRLDQLPAGLLVAGDAVASFNPVYGQGMTSAALHASCLSAYLRSQPALDQPARSYFSDVRVVVDAAWQTSTFADLALPHIQGPYPRGYRTVKWISDLILEAAATHPSVNARLSRVTTMLAHPNSLMHPGVLLPALRTALPSGRRDARTSSPVSGY